MLSLGGLVVLGLLIGANVLTLMVVQEIRKDEINWDRVRAVEICQWVVTGLLGLVVLSILLAIPAWRSVARVWSQSVSDVQAQLKV